jgi:hypothetical protein
MFSGMPNSVTPPDRCDEPGVCRCDNDLRARILGTIRGYVTSAETTR